MTRSRLRNRYLSLPSHENKLAYKFQTYVLNCLGNVRGRITVSLILRIFLITRSFGILLKLFCSDKINASHKISLINGNIIISENKEIAEIFTDFF